ncbi:MAG TPA: hypothetical protein VFZ25_17685 [Chloroflexota bacterium]|nr:hypothetical protein [Chloroflexota bacterium]
MAEHDANYFLDALKKLDWNRGFTGDELVNLFNNFPVGWFAKVPLDKTFQSWEDFWVYVTPISVSTRGPEVHEEQAEKFCSEEAQKKSIGWGR